MAYQLIAHCRIRDFSTKPDGTPDREYPHPFHRHIVIDTFADIKDARKAAETTQYIYADPPDNTYLLSEHEVFGIEIREVPD